MKFNTFKKFKFTCDFYDFTQVTGTEGENNRVYEFDRNINVRAQATIAGRFQVFFQNTEADVRGFAQLANLRDAEGTLVRPGTVWVVDSITPKFNHYGQREGFVGFISYFGEDGTVI